MPGLKMLRCPVSPYEGSELVSPKNTAAREHAHGHDHKDPNRAVCRAVNTTAAAPSSVQGHFPTRTTVNAATGTRNPRPC